MTSAPSPVVIFVPVPTAGSPSWPREARRAWRKLADNRGDRWAKQQAIPTPGPIVDRDLLDRLKQAAKHMLDETRSLRAELLAA
jgi:hypothetical protein